MKTIGRMHKSFRKRMGVLVLAAVLTVGMLGTAVTAYAESAAKVTASTAKIRKEPSTSSETVGSAENGKTISVTGQTTGSDGYTWYQVYVDSSTLGYIRSDLVSITDGSTPATVSATTTTTTTTTGGSTATTSTPDETVVDVTAVTPVSASVSGSSPVRVRQNASTTSRIYATVESGSALTVTGTATGTDGNQWYQVNFISGGSEVNGFIRADYVALSGELTELQTETDETGTDVGTETDADDTEETTTKDWDTYQSDDGAWHLQNNTDGNIYSITQIFDSVENNVTVAENALAAKKTLQTVVIILVILMVAMVAVIGYLIFRLKDMEDSAYYREVEQETLRKRASIRQQDGRQASRQGAGGQQRTAARTGSQTGKSSASEGRRPVSGQSQTRSGAAAANGQRTAVRTGSQGQTVKPSAAGSQRTVTPSDKSEAAERPQAADEAEQSVSKTPEKSTAADKTAERTPSAQKTTAQSTQPQKPAWKSKNFVADDDEFEFEFLNWDGEDE